MSFQDVVGQTAGIAFLKAAYQQGRVAHAYVFLGPDGVGKKKTALHFAKLLLCQDPRAAEACGRCASCLKAENLSHPDLQWVAPEGQFIKIDAIREACRRLSLRGFESTRKVLIVVDAQHLNEESSNALLKTLEEPTDHTVIILIAETLRSVLPTIASRCQRVVFSPLPEKEIVALLAQRGGISREEGLYLARVSGGSLGRALELQASGLFRRKNEILKNILDRRCALEDCLDLSSRERQDKQAGISEVLGVLSSWFRDLWVAKAAGPCSEPAHIDRKEEIARLAATFSYAELEERLLAITDVTRDLRRNMNPRVALTKLRVDLWKP